jgi:hypothetical protein
MWSMSASDHVFLALILFSDASLMQLLYRLSTDSALSAAGRRGGAEAFELAMEPLRDKTEDWRWSGLFPAASARASSSASVNERFCVSLACLASLLRRFSSASLLGLSTPRGAACGDFKGVLLFPLAFGPLGVVFISPRTPIVRLPRGKGGWTSASMEGRRRGARRLSGRNARALVVFRPGARPRSVRLGGRASRPLETGKNNAPLGVVSVGTRRARRAAFGGSAPPGSSLAGRHAPVACSTAIRAVAGRGCASME